jgi:hypothetical protein
MYAEISLNLPSLLPSCSWYHVYAAATVASPEETNNRNPSPEPVKSIVSVL